MKIEMISPDKLSFAEYNPRSIKTPALDRLKKSLNSSNGLSLFERRPILVNKRDGKLIVYAGNQRLKAARELGFKTVPVIVDEISIEEEKERNIKDNLSVGEWDDDLIQSEFNLNDLEAWGFDVNSFDLNSSDTAGLELKSIFEVTVECINELDQKKIFDDLTKKGYTCRILTL